VFWAKVTKSEVGIYPNAKWTFLPVLCNHCVEPACVDVCPTGASYKREDGVVLVDPEKCIGCRYCMVACPYNARYFSTGNGHSYFPEMELTPYEEVRKDEHVVGTVGKCNFCVDRIAEGKEPACVQACPCVARIFGDMDDPESEVSQLVASKGAYQLFPEVGTEPSVYYLPG
jgi:molybdopterin-containing oxidoreductase family iron-sulfur binding subunit